MHCLKIKYWLKKICFLLLVLSPALYKLAWGSECYLLVDAAAAVGIWVSAICLFIDKKFKFCKKLFDVVISIAIIFLAYIGAMSIGYPLVSKYLSPEDKYLGFSIIIIGLVLCCLIVFWIFRDEVKEYEKYYRLVADGITAIIAIVLLYDNYYGVSDLVKILILNKGFVGLPIVIYFVRFLVSGYVLNKEENSKEKITKKTYIHKIRISCGKCN
jgi:hypothetical protein